MNRDRWLALALVVSLALNVFLGSIVGGHWLSRLAKEDRGERTFLPYYAAEALGEAAQPAIQDVWRDYRDRFRPAYESYRDSREAARDAMRAEPFEPERLSAALDEIGQRRLEVYQVSNQAMLELAQRLTPEQRRILADTRPPWRKKRDSK